MLLLTEGSEETVNRRSSSHSLSLPSKIRPLEVFVTYNGNLVKSEGMESASALRKLTGFLSLMAFMRSANKLHARNLDGKDLIDLIATYPAVKTNQGWDDDRRPNCAPYV